MLELVVGLALGVAQDTLKDILTDFVLNKRKRRLSESDIERIVAEMVGQHQASLTVDVQDQVRDLALAEVHKIIESHPGLVWERHKIKPVPDIEEHARKLELDQQIQGLQQIIEGRRRELGLPLTETEAVAELSAAPAAPREPAENATPPETKEPPSLPALRQAQPPDLPSYWKQRAEQTRRQLSDWHSTQRPPPSE